MRRQGQSTILVLVLLLPACAIAMVGLALLGARVQGERAQRLADVAALRAAEGLAVGSEPGVELVVQPQGLAWRASVRLRTTRLSLVSGRVAFSARASAVARPITTADGRPGAVLVG